MSIPPNFDRHGDLRPTGRLTLIPEEVVLHHHPNNMVQLKALAVDEIGAVWDVSYPRFFSEMRPHRYPSVLQGTYHLQQVREGKDLYGGGLEVQASSLEEAIATAMTGAAGYVFSDVSLRLEHITAPCAPADSEPDAVGASAQALRDR